MDIDIKTAKRHTLEKYYYELVEDRETFAVNAVACSTADEREGASEEVERVEIEMSRVASELNRRNG